MFGSNLGTITSQLLKEGNSNRLCGTVIDSPARSLQACSLTCLHQDRCKGILFLDQTVIPKSCKLITSESETEIDSFDFSDYTQYLFTISCSGFYGNNTFVPPLNWNSGCPAAYFPLESASEGTSYGNDPLRIDFSQPTVN